MRFSHTADCHVGGHRDPRLKALTEQAFERFIDESIAARVDFIIIAGDLFNTAIPGIDTLKFVVSQLSRARKEDIPIYAIPGSHDFSPSGKTMLDVLEEAGLLVNVCRGTVTEEGLLKLQFTIDKKTGAKLTGVIGKRGMLDRKIYEELDRSIEREPGTKIFLFHTAITELKPQYLQEMDSAPISFLPKGFTYYAGGHVHIVERYAQAGYENVIYPGPLFPNSFTEMERLRHGTYYLYENEKVTKRDIILKEVVSLTIDVDGKSAHEANGILRDATRNIQSDTIITLRIEGTLSSGSPNDIDIRGVVNDLETHGAYAVLRNTSKLSSSEFVAVQSRHEEPHELEEHLLREHKDQLSIEGNDGVALTKDLLRILSRETHEGEKTAEYEENIVKDTIRRLQ